MLTERMQILLEPDQRKRLEAEAKRRGTSVASLIREAIDRMYPTTSDQRRAAGDAVLEAEPMPVPNPAELRQELDERRGQPA